MKPCAIRESAVAVAAAVADRLATPEQGRALAGDQWWPQSLAQGAAGITLLHIERARTGHGSWDRVHRWLECAVADGVQSSTRAHLYYGAPALAFVLHQAVRAGAAYENELARLDAVVDRIVVQRLEWAHARISRAELPTLNEFDAIRGLAGLGVLLLLRAPGTSLVKDVLAYLVRLTEPISVSGRELPGWWTPVGPGGRTSADFPGGHANNGMAHGIAGVLSVLAVAALNGTSVSGQHEAIRRICAWFDRWRRVGLGGVWWPYWITPALYRDDEEPSGPRRPSWCYGTSGIARAQQLAARALKDTERHAAAEAALRDALTHPAALAKVDDASLCHGYAGLALLAHHSGQADPDALLNAIMDGASADAVARRLIAHRGINLLEGAAGTATALHTLGGAQPGTEGDSLLMITGKAVAPHG
ncbi:MAG TPA: lanthionine synthetase C family protein [Thermobifida alba]|nr:lanthionine synthetase C family protein [Thermobifida alba]